MKLFKKTLLICICMLCLIIPILNIQVNAMPNVTIKDGNVTLADNKITSAEQAKITVIDRYKGLITFFGGLATITMVGIFIKHFVELGAKASNPRERHEITSGLVWSGLAAACLGSVTFLFSVAYGVFK